MPVTPTFGRSLTQTITTITFIKTSKILRGPTKNMHALLMKTLLKLNYTKIVLKLYFV